VVAGPTLASAVAWTLLAVGGFALTAGTGGPTWVAWTAAGAALAFFAIGLLRRLRIQATTDYRVTSLRTYSAVGRLFFRLHVTTHEKITGMDVHQGPIGNRAGYGTVVVRTAGGDLRLHAVRDLFAVRSGIEEARQAFLAALVEEDRAASQILARAAATAPTRAASEATERRLSHRVRQAEPLSSLGAWPPAGRSGCRGPPRTRSTGVACVSGRRSCGRRSATCRGGR